MVSKNFCGQMPGRENKRDKTMAYINIPGTDSGLVGFLKQFDTAMQEHAATLGFDALEEAAVTDAYNEFDTDVTAVLAAKDALKGLVTAKTVQRTTSVALVRDFAQRIKTNPAATPEIQASFGISTTPSSSGPVTVPTLLTAEPAATSVCKLSWNRNGNSSATTFTIEARGSTTGAWTFVGTTTKTKFNDANATPGVPRYYRVRASRGNTVSAWSIEAVIYSGGSGGSGFLEVAA